MLSKSSNNAINYITIIASLGIVLGAAALFVVLSGFAGLKDFTLQFTSIVDPDFKAIPATGKSFFISENDSLQLDSSSDLFSYSKVLEERVIVTFDDKNFPAFIKGVDDKYKFVNAIESVIFEGSWLTQNTNQIVVGWGVSNSLSFSVLDYGKRVQLSIPKAGKGQVSSVRQAFSTEKAINVGIFDINEALNDKYVYAGIDLAQNLLGFKNNQVSSLEFKITEGIDHDLAKSRIEGILGDKIIMKNRAQLNDALYKMLNSENLFVYLLLTLVSIILIFNVIGSLIMMILDKKQTLNTLFNLGATLKDIRKIFFLQGIIMTVLGTLLGLLIGFVVVCIQQGFSLVMITPSLPYPMSIHVENFVIVFLTITILGIIASRIAATRISKSLLKAV